MEHHFGQKFRFISRWQVEIFMMTGWDSYDDRSRLSRSQIEISIIAGPDFYDNRSKFSWWQVEIFMITDWDFRDVRSRFFFSFLVLLKEKMMQGKSKISSFCFYINQKNWEVGWVQDSLSVTLVLESFHSGLLHVVTNFWADTYLESVRRSKMEIFLKILNGFKTLSTFAKKLSL